jgi:mediator of RNA polymerase II transcription subunit 7
MAVPLQAANMLGNVPQGPASQQNGEPVQVSSMPPPPMQYIKHYTDDNVRRGIAPAPPPPITDSYTMFGNVFTAEDCIVASLESQGIRRLYSAKDVDRKRELRKLNHSVLVNFLDLLDFVIKYPDSEKRVEKIADLNLLFIHMHHLINEFRPHQARETLRVMLHVQVPFWGVHCLERRFFLYR